MAVLSRAPAERTSIAIPTWDLWLTNLVTAVNEATTAAALPAAAGTLTGTTLAANVVNSSLVITDGQLSSNVALKNGTNAFTGANSFATNVLDLLVGQMKFPASQNASADANTLDDYEEGTWTPVDGSGAGLAFTVGTAQYVKVGQDVFVSADLVYPATASGANARIGGLPFTTQAAQSGFAIGYETVVAVARALVRGSNTVVDLFTTAGVNVTNLQMSASNIVLSGTYRASA